MIHHTFSDIFRIAQGLLKNFGPLFLQYHTFLRLCRRKLHGYFCIQRIHFHESCLTLYVHGHVGTNFSLQTLKGLNLRLHTARQIHSLVEFTRKHWNISGVVLQVIFLSDNWLDNRAYRSQASNLKRCRLFLAYYILKGWCEPFF